MVTSSDHIEHHPRAPDLLHATSEEKKLYWDRSNYDSIESQMKALQSSKTLYIGNLTFATRSSHLDALFSMIGPVAAIIMGLDRIQKTPCGFAFVEYVRRKDALNAVSYLSGTKLDGRPIRVELDAGFKPGRQYGRGSSGGQVRDDRRRGRVDPSRSSSKSPKAIIASNRWSPPHNYQAPGLNKRSFDENTKDSEEESAKKARIG